MHSAKLIHYTKRVWQLGLAKTTTILARRAHSWVTDRKQRSRAYNHTANHTWPQIQRALKINISFPEYILLISSHQTEFLALRSSLIKGKNLKDLCTTANDYAQQCFDILGSGKQCFKDIPWHTDFRLTKQHPALHASFPWSLFYRDINITIGKTEELEKDIKMCWDLSRLSHFFIMGCAYHETQAPHYYESFLKQLQSWKESNPFLLGPNWLCPMDVGLRAINLIWAFYFFADTQQPQAWTEELVCLLYDHLYYLENNWERYDERTSNHYLSDLIGYLYCCAFFKDAPGIASKLSWCRQEILREMESQIFQEGADYEGSTRYHCLATEIFFHAQLICDYLAIPMPPTYHNKLKLMFEFINWCTPVNGSLIFIGDHDSGTIVTGISPELLQTFVNPAIHIKKEFKEFGLSIIKTDNWHISLRHHSYTPRQPSGHFHNDVGSITLAYKGMAVFIDPASYVYTPSVIWRNLFRSVTMHNTFWIGNQEPVSLDYHLFGLEIPENRYIPEFTDEYTLSTHHRLYNGLEAHRTLVLKPEQKSVNIHDSWHWLSDEQKKRLLATNWNFTLAPDIKPIAIAGGIMLNLPNGEQMHLASPLSFQIVSSWASPEYGSKVATHALRTTKSLASGQTVEILFSVGN